jgi:predicted acetyltransferase
MSFDVRSAANLDEYRRALFSIWQYFGAELDDERAERFSRLLPFDHMLAAFDGDEIVGGAGSFPFELSVPGGSIACAGTTVVGVAPTHRRRGVLRAMMRVHLDQARERGEPIAALWASEETIYGRYGYGRAAFAGEVEVPRERTEFVSPVEPQGTVRVVERDEAVEAFPPIHEALRRERPGMFSRSREWWEQRNLDDPAERRGGAGPKRFALLELDGEPAAYAIYRHQAAWDGGVTASKLVVVEAVGRDARATAELWRFLLGVDWVAKITTTLVPPDHPLFYLLAEPRRMRFRLGDGVWVRLVDVGAALSARTYAADDELVFEVRDAFCDWNDGRWRLANGRAERTDAEPDLRCDASVLGAAYLGGERFAALAQANLVEELTPGAIERADGVFRHGLHPWCPEIF